MSERVLALEAEVAELKYLKDKKELMELLDSADPQISVDRLRGKVIVKNQAVKFTRL